MALAIQSKRALIINLNQIISIFHGGGLNIEIWPDPQILGKFQNICHFQNGLTNTN